MGTTEVLGMLITVAGTGAQESQQPTLPQCIEINKKVDIAFTRARVEALCKKAILSYMDVPFEVVGFKQLFAHMLNQANMSENEIKEICSNKDLSEDVRLKLQNVIKETFIKAVDRIKADKLQCEIEWRKQNYAYNFDLSLWDQGYNIPAFVRSKVHNYVKYLDLENDFDVDNLRAHYEIKG